MDLVTIDRILLVSILIFDDWIDGCLVPRELDDQETYRICIFMDGELIDFATGTVLSHLNMDDDGYIIPEVYTNTMYVNEVYKCPNVTEDMYEYAQELYQNYLSVKDLKENKQILEFKQKRIY